MERRSIAAGVLDIGYLEAGRADAPVAILMHGFPYDALACVEAGANLAADGWRVLIPWMRGYGPTRFRDDATPRSGEQAAFGADLLALMDALGIERAVLAGYDWGGRAACVVSALHPERVAGLVSGGGYNIMSIAAIGSPAPPDWERRLWYVYYFHGERGRSGLGKFTGELARVLWHEWSPSWAFDEATFARSAAAFDNPDFVDVVIHSYRHRFGLVAGDPAYADDAAQLERQPVIDVPAILLQGEDDGVDPRRDLDAAKFPQLLRREIVAGGHNLIQENPLSVVAAINALR